MQEQIRPGFIGKWSFIQFGWINDQYHCAKTGLPRPDHVALGVITHVDAAPRLCSSLPHCFEEYGRIRLALAKNCREALEIIHPEIKQLNRKEGALIELREAIKNRVAIIENRQLLGLAASMRTGAGAGVGYAFGGETGGRVGAILGFSYNILDDPVVKAKLALTLARVREIGIQPGTLRTAGRIGAYEVGKAQMTKEQ